MGAGNYLLTVLCLTSVFGGAEGVALGLVLQNIKADLSLTDTQLGLLMGIAFSLTYALVGLAVAQWADRGDRVAILAVAAAVCGVLVAACGVATNFHQLFLLRVGVGIGEAGCFPASMSLIAAYFDRAKRPRATSIYVMSAGFVYLIGYGVAGWLNQLYGWRFMFMLLGIPLLALAILAWLTLRDPRVERLYTGVTLARIGRPVRSLFKTAVAAKDSPRLKDVALTLWSSHTLRHLFVFWTALGFVTVGMGRWQPAFFGRNHGLNTGQIGAWFALVYGIGGALGPALGGAWASRYAINKEHLMLKVAAGVWLAMTVLSASIYLVPNVYVSMALMVLYMVILTAICGLFWATVQTLVPQGMRAAAVAIFALFNSLVGSGLGPLAVGIMSDALRGPLGKESLQCALLLLSFGFLWGALHLWWASTSVACDLAATPKEWPSGGDSSETASAARA